MEMEEAVRKENGGFWEKLIEIAIETPGKVIRREIYPRNKRTLFKRRKLINMTELI